MNENKFQKDHLFPVISSIAAGVLMFVALYVQGRLLWCKSGDYRIYVNEAWNSSHTSQHFFDPYTFTHVLHGVMFFWLVNLIFPKLGVGWQFFIAIAAEAAWEILENSNFIIEKYRENTASLDYFGDSVLNSVGDLIACAIGFLIAQKIGWWKSFIFFLLTEIVLLIWIRDGLLLNILMLIYPLDAVKNWQMSL